MTVRALVDSGADFSVLPIKLASILDVRLEQCREMACGTAGGPGVVLVRDLPLEAEIESLGMRFAMRAAFTEHVSMTLLGLDDFFRVFRVTFDHANESFSLQPYDRRG